MASTDISTSSSHLSAGTGTGSSGEHKRQVDESFLNKMKGLVERLRLDNATLRKTLDVERSGVRALKAQHEAALRHAKTEYKKKEEFLEKQLRMTNKPDKPYDEAQVSNKLVELKKLTAEIQSLKAANRSLQEKLKVSQAAESARAAEVRAQAARHAALEHAVARDARAQYHKLLEELRSKERLIARLQRDVRARCHTLTEAEQTHSMESRVSTLGRHLRVDQGKDRSDREDLKTDIQHRKETFYRTAAASECDSALSSAPPSLSPQPPLPSPAGAGADMWSCATCRVAEGRAAAHAREVARLSDALRDARDQLELMEFRLLELEDAHHTQGVRENLTDSDSGCVSPGSRIKDSASPELKRMDSGYKSPLVPGSPCLARRPVSHDDFREEFVRAQVQGWDGAEVRSGEGGGGAVEQRLQQMVLRAGSPQDRACLEQVLVMLYNYHQLTSSVTEDDQITPKRQPTKSESDIPLHKPLKAIATVTPYSQQYRGYKTEPIEYLDTVTPYRYTTEIETLHEERKPSNMLQESGIFEEVETESIGTQTDVNDPFECTGELNTEIQRLNSIREKLERQGRNRSLGVKEESEGLECRCVKLGKKHQQYYERRLRFLEGKISIYEAAQDVRRDKLAERLQNEFVLQNRIQELESQLSDLHDKYERLEEDCCELEEIENDTRLHWQQLEIEYELCSAQLRDLTEQRECSLASTERLLAQLEEKEMEHRHRESELSSSLTSLQRVVPALIVWNMVRVAACVAPRVSHRATPQPAIMCRSDLHHLVTPDASGPTVTELEEEISKLIEEKQAIEENSLRVKESLEERVSELQEDLTTLRRMTQANEEDGGVLPKEDRPQPNEEGTEEKENETVISESEEDLLQRISELERRESAYLEMLTQADDMWAEMEAGYKRSIEEAQQTERAWIEQVNKLSAERDDLRSSYEPLKTKLKEIQESESTLRIALDKSERDVVRLESRHSELALLYEKVNTDYKHSEMELRALDAKFKKELEQLRKVNKQLIEELSVQRESARHSERVLGAEREALRRELARLHKSHQDLDTTTSELREEVESLEKQLALTQKALSSCKRKCDDKIKTISHELSIKTEELEELRSETMRQSLQASAARDKLRPDRTEYVDEGFKAMHHSLGYLPGTRCSCPLLRCHLVAQLIEDLFARVHRAADTDLMRLVDDITPVGGRAITSDTKAKITNFLLMAISKELVRSIGDADAKTDTEEWQRCASSMSQCVPVGDSAYSLPRDAADNHGVVRGARRLASVSAACAAARLCAAAPALADHVKICQEEVLDHSDVKIMEEQLANAIESIVNCPSCALGTNAIVWSTDV